MEDCIFCKIVEGKSAGYKIAENKNWIAILDIAPITFGHVLVISKKHYKNYLETPIDTLNDAHQLIETICLKIKDKLNAKGFNITTNINRQANQVIFHMHWHIIPRYDEVYQMKPNRLTITAKELQKLEKMLKI
ncbi:HIT family protein [Mycoplasma sp. SG1]|uniref:HIT family protein n=1 Tax=Mycoplasma sp. SG1 TaxID=2810348 RepID=UPI002025844B|nr:HIT domain-containing protein [Mycoplasma sp. SG1]URM52749.1 HIT domain-containing protein [Mycoplasma sp. SG1]